MFTPRDYSNKWILGVAILIAVLALFGGLSLNNSSWLQPAIGNARAEALQADTAYANAKRKLDLTNYESEITSEIRDREEQAKYEQIQRQQEINYQVAHDAQSLTIRQRFSDVGMIILLILGISLGSGIVVAIIRTVKNKVAAQQSADPSGESRPKIQIEPLQIQPVFNPWKSEKYRKEQINKAKENEQYIRGTMLKVRTMQTYNRMQKMSKKERGDLPLAS
jgi:hypothetical protein